MAQHDYKLWSAEEDSYLLDSAGLLTLEVIAKRLGRSPGAVGKRLNRHFNLMAKHNQGFLSAAEVAKEFRCPYQRVRDALSSNLIKGKYDPVRNMWLVDLAQLGEQSLSILKAPKLTHKTTETDLGNYYARYGLKRIRPVSPGEANDGDTIP